MNIFNGHYGYTPPRWPGLPFSIDAPLSIQQLAWFAPMGFMLLAVRHILSIGTLKWVLNAVLLNAAAMAVFGLVQSGLGWTRLFGFIPIEGSPHLISTFDYPNHGGAFFYLLFALSIGLLIDALEKHKSAKKNTVIVALIVLFGITALASLSRYAVLAVLGISLAGLLCWTALKFRHFSTGNWVNLAIFSGLISVLFVLGLLNVGQGAVLREFKNKSEVKPNWATYYQENRGFQLQPAFEMVADYPWFGVGGWGYRRYLRVYLSDAEYEKYASVGRANVHCDPVQFLAEHGFVGFGLMTAGLISLLAPWRKLPRWRFRGLALMTLVGASAVFLHSLIDLPFRCPTVLWHWLLLLTMVPMLAGRRFKSNRDKEPVCGDAI
ncbi:O-antigen ligase family protein [Pontiellaceae bacterium B12219]|nr:O-antigen ligase family protein [Pontiellaceae bacterium B12219]